VKGAGAVWERDPPARHDVPEAGLGPIRLDAEEGDLPGHARDEAGGAVDMGDEGGIVLDVVIARKDGDVRAGLPSLEMEEAAEESRTGVAVLGLHEHVAGRQRAELLAGDREVVLADDHERALGGSERPDPVEGRFEHRAVAPDPTVLLRDRLSCDPGRQLLETCAVAAGQDERPPVGGARRA
jgi:hypothetical protein